MQVCGDDEANTKNLKHQKVETAASSTPHQIKLST